MRYINANIKSKKELYHRLLNGEQLFILEGTGLLRAFYDTDKAYPFRIKCDANPDDPSFALGTLAENYSMFCIADPKKWWEFTLPVEGLLVYNGKNPKIIVSIDNDIAVTEIGTRFHVNDLSPIMPNDPRLFKESINEI